MPILLTDGKSIRQDVVHLQYAKIEAHDTTSSPHNIMLK